MGRQTHKRSISVAKAIAALMLRLLNIQGMGEVWVHTSLCPDDGSQGRACDAPRLDFSIPCTLDGNT